MAKPLIILLGPTASGKSYISIEIAQLLNCEIISADSMQVYKYMDIGTAKLKPEEMKGIKHYLIDVVYPDEDFSVAVFRDMAKKHIDEILKRGKLPMVVGGTGLYINSLTYNLDFTETVGDREYRNELLNLAKEYGNEHIHEMLKDIDPESYKRLHKNDLKRIIRALEVYKHTGRTISEYQKQSKEKPIEYDLCMVGLTMDRQRLYERINMRVDDMIRRGLTDEVKWLLDMGYDRSLTSMQGLGYKEMAAYIFGELTLEDAVDLLKQSTRHFAKRQLTWFRREDRIRWFNLDDINDINEGVKNIKEHIAGKFNLV